MDIQQVLYVYRCGADIRETAVIVGEPWMKVREVLLAQNAMRPKGTNGPADVHFWSLARGAPEECWEWQGFRSPLGYGRVFVAGRMQFAHRVAFYFTHGHWPRIARHTCDNPPCCNPAHLLDGTQADNVRDKTERGGTLMGETHPMAKLSKTDVLEIRLLAENLSLRELSDRFGVSSGQISLIVRRKSWRHIDTP